MTLVQLQTLQQVIDLALDTLKNQRTQEVVAWIRENYPDTLAENDVELQDIGLEYLVRERRKARSPLEEAKASRNICFDFGIDPILLDSEISIPRDVSDPVYGGSEWKDADDASLLEIDKHIALLEAQALSTLQKADNWRRIRQSAAQYANGDLTLTLRELRRRARNRTINGITDVF